VSLQCWKWLFMENKLVNNETGIRRLTSSLLSTLFTRLLFLHLNTGIKNSTLKTVMLCSTRCGTYGYINKRYSQKHISYSKYYDSTLFESVRHLGYSHRLLGYLQRYKLVNSYPQNVWYSSQIRTLLLIIGHRLFQIPLNTQQHHTTI
jgi:hypothetical protein